PLHFAVGIAQDASGAFEMAGEDLPFSPYAVFGPLQLARIAAGAQTLQVAFAPAHRALPQEDLLGWIETQARALVAFYGRLPVDQMLLVISPAGGRRPHGRTMGGGGATILYSLPDSVTREILDRDWVLVHELVHTAFPALTRRGQHWAEEGLATYLEP